MVKDWIAQVKQRGWAGGLEVTLDVLEPFGPLAAQVLYILQPTTRIFGLGEAVQDIAHALDTPGGIAQLRARLNHPDEQA